MKMRSPAVVRIASALGAGAIGIGISASTRGPHLDLAASLARPALAASATGSGHARPPSARPTVPASIAPASSAPASPAPASSAPASSAPITFRELIGALAERIDRIPHHPALAAEHRTLCARHGMDDSECEAFTTSFYRTRALFEATRDGGLFRLRWAITNQEPSSRRIWAQWSKLDSFFGPATATAECDEISSLFAFLARELGVRSVGLFYPTWNHTIAAYSPAEILDPKRRKATRVLIPTTQIFLSCEAGFDTTTFDERKQPVFEYPLHELSANSKIPSRVAEFLLEQLEVYGPCSPDLLELLRLHRAERFRSSLQDCTGRRRTLVERLRVEGVTEREAAAIQHYLAHELGEPDIPPARALSVLARAISSL